MCSAYSLSQAFLIIFLGDKTEARKYLGPHFVSMFAWASYECGATYTIDGLDV